MEIPKEIVGRNRIRDTRICLEYISGVSPENLCEYKWVNLTVRRVYRILFANQLFINPRLTWPKSRRIWMLQNMIDNAVDSKKDKADLLEQHRRESEGDKPLIEQHHHYGNMTDDELIKHARAKGIDIPDAIKDRIGQESFR